MKASSNRTKDAVIGFWRWFASNADRLKELHSSKQFGRLAEEMNRELDKIDRRLAWEMGCGLTRPFMLTVSGEGNPELRDLAESVINQSPKLNDWDFFSAHPSRPAPSAVRLAGSGEIFEASAWSFAPVERPERGQLDLIIVDDHLANSNRESALKAISIYLDQTLGEDTVESWIGMLSVESRSAAQGRKLFKMDELSDYLLWITHRENQPLTKPARSRSR